MSMEPHEERTLEQFQSEFESAKEDEDQEEMEKIVARAKELGYEIVTE